MSRPQPGLLALLFPHSTVLKNTFPFKKEEKIQELMEAGGWHPNSSNADLLNYRSLFIEVGMYVLDSSCPGTCPALPKPLLDPNQRDSHPALWALPG